MSWYLDNNNQLNHADLAVGIEGGIFTSPYPLSLWNFISSTDSTLTLNNEGFNIMLHPIVDPEHDRNDTKNLTAPYPASVWYFDTDNKISMGLLPDSLPLGAFARCTSFSKIVIPEATKSIGEESFTETALLDVTIAEDCSYYPTSFPEGCEIKHY